MGVTEGMPKAFWALSEAASARLKGVPKPRVREVGLRAWL